MSEEDARLCIQRHATSKLRSLAELSKIQSFGFRGEALPSIASVSRFTLRTRARGSDAGIEIVVEGGAAPRVRPVGVPPGTTIGVHDLFYNVPARRKFLRSTGTESGHVADVVENAALARPEVTFTLERDGRKVREWLRAASREERVRAAFPDEELAACRGERGPLSVEAFLSRPERARAGAAGLKILVNGRPIRDRALSLTLAQAYGSVLERGRYPRGVLYLDLPPELVDVNVHPQKAEVRFADPRALTDALYGCLSRALATAFSLPRPSRSPWANRPATPAQAPVSVPEPMSVSVEPAPVEVDPWGLAPQPVSAPPVDAPSAARATLVRAEATRAAQALLFVHDAASDERPGGTTRTPVWSRLTFIAQLRATYLVCEGADGLYILDQHAAAERVTFTKLRREYDARTVATQSLLFPLLLEVPEQDVTLVEEHAARIGELGLDVRVRGRSSLSVHAVPKLLQRANPERLLGDLLSELSRSDGRGFSAAVDLAVATMACHGSVRAGDVLTPEESRSLLQALDQADFAGHCPHGRPVVTFISYAELERKVGRR